MKLPPGEPVAVSPARYTTSALPAEECPLDIRRATPLPVILPAAAVEVVSILTFPEELELAVKVRIAPEEVVAEAPLSSSIWPRESNLAADSPLVTLDPAVKEIPSAPLENFFIDSPDITEIPPFVWARMFAAPWKPTLPEPRTSLEPDVILTLPPVEANASPAASAMSPAAPERVLPVATARSPPLIATTDPESSPTECPVKTCIFPDAAESVERIEVEPLAPPTLCPLVRCTLPPTLDAEVEVPALIEMSPLSEVTWTPPLLAALFPVFREIVPDKESALPDVIIFMAPPLWACTEESPDAPVCWDVPDDTVTEPPWRRPRPPITLTSAPDPPEPPPETCNPSEPNSAAMDPVPATLSPVKIDTDPDVTDSCVLTLIWPFDPEESLTRPPTLDALAPAWTFRFLELVKPLPWLRMIEPALLPDADVWRSIEPEFSEETPVSIFMSPLELLGAVSTTTLPDAKPDPLSKRKPPVIPDLPLKIAIFELDSLVEATRFTEPDIPPTPLASTTVPDFVNAFPLVTTVCEDSAESLVPIVTSPVDWDRDSSVRREISPPLVPTESPERKIKLPELLPAAM
jgi:hypothetical protein